MKKVYKTPTMKAHKIEPINICAMSHTPHDNGNHYGHDKDKDNNGHHYGWEKQKDFF